KRRYLSSPAGTLRLAVVALFSIWRRLVGRDAIDALQPAAKVDIGTALGAKQARARGGRLAADGAGSRRLQGLLVFAHPPLDRFSPAGCRRSRGRAPDRRRRRPDGRDAFRARAAPPPPSPRARLRRPDGRSAS